MNAQIISGRELQQEIVSGPLADAAARGIRPVITLIVVKNDDPMLAINQGLHQRTIARHGIEYRQTVLSEEASLGEVSAAIRRSNDDPAVHGVMVLLPLPGHLDIRDVLPLIDPDKELEGLHPDHSAGLVRSNRATGQQIQPLVGESILLSAAKYGINLEHRNIAVLTEEGLMHSNPVANMMIRCAAPAMLPINSSLDLVPLEHPAAQERTRLADVLIVSLEHPEVVDAAWIKPGAAVIDFNPSLVSFEENAEGPPSPVLRGGVNADSAAGIASQLMPVPGGIGPVMLGILMRNLTNRALQSSQSSEPAEAERAALT